MALLLLIETSTTSCSVALAENETILACKEQNERNIHASSITLFVDEVLKSANKTIQDLSAVAVSMGPGSYTGLRIGVSAAKGLCYALDIPLIAVSTLEAMTSGIMSRNEELNVDLYCPMIDARRMEVYTAIFNDALEQILPIEAKIIDEFSFEELLKEKRILFFGDGAGKCQQLFADIPNAQFLPDFVNSAKDMAKLANQKFRSAQFENVAYFEPYYLKDFLVTQPKSNFSS